MTRDEWTALVLYTAADRDFVDYLDMMNEPHTVSDQALLLLKRILEASPSPKTDVELNKLALGPLLKVLKARGLEW